MIGWLRKSIPLWIVLVVVAGIAGLTFVVGRWIGGAAGLAALIYMTAKMAKAKRQRNEEDAKARTEHAKATAKLTADWKAERAAVRSKAAAKGAVAGASAGAAADDINDLLGDL